MILAIKLILVPVLIWGMTLAGRRWGPTIGGWLSAFPILSAPILFIIALDHGTSFAASATLSTLTAVLGNASFGIGYAWGATRFSWGPCVMLGFAGYFLVVACLYFWAPSLYFAIPAVLAGLLIAPRLYPPVTTQPHPPAIPANDMPLRMATGVGLVLLVTHFSSALGPQLSGALAMFPMMAPVLAVFSHRQSGAAFATDLLRGMVLGYYSFSVFCITLYLALPATSVGLAFLIALACAALTQSISRLHLVRSRRTVLTQTR
jgi:hypothetical protein